MPKDSTLSTLSAFGSISWAAERLGMSKNMFLKKRDTLEAEGFPEPDPLTTFYLKADVDAWIDHRRRVPDAPANTGTLNRTRSEVNFDAV
jgi:hypothetical protein